MNNGPIFKYTVGYCWGTGPDTGDAEMEVEALDIIQAVLLAKKKLGREFHIVSVEQKD